ncbi:MAG TPA: DUF882 domain-containing protein [Polyangiaceae bacterium]
MSSAGRLAAAVALSFVVAVTAAVAQAGTDANGRKTHTVYPGQTLGRIAKRYNVSVDALCHVNGLRHGTRIRPGQKLVIPDREAGTGGAANEEPAVRRTRWQEYMGRPRKPGFVVLESPTKHWQGVVLTPRGKLLPKSRDAIERMFASWRTGAEHDIEPRLLRLVVKMSDTFGGRPIRVVSGYREHSFAVESKHKVGRAFDFSIPGIPNSLVRDYLRTLPNVGVGYYPNSTHVHVDVREDSAYWVDDAAPGEPPSYAGRGKSEDPAAESEATAAEPTEAAAPPVTQ